MENREFEYHLALLEQRRQLTEFQYSSRIPILGALLNRFRSLWLSIAARWYIRHYMQQQQTFNHTVIDTVRLIVAQSEHRDREIVARYEQQLNQIQNQLTAVQTQLTHTKDQLNDTIDKLIDAQEEINRIQNHVKFVQETQVHDFKIITQTLNNRYDKQ